jgi:prepilin-type N-terminal cleavage/methylation domain-containing protein
MTLQGPGQGNRSRLSSQRGFTLIELVIVMGLGIIVIGVPLLFILLSLSQQNVSSSRSAAATQEQVGLERMDRDIRQAVASPSSTFSWGSTSASVQVYVPVAGSGGASTQKVTWSCTFGAAGSCSRQVDSGAPVTLMTGVENVTFAPLDGTGSALGGSGPSYAATNPAYVGITVKVLDTSQLDHSSSPSQPVPGINNWLTLQDGIDLRNNSL